MNKKLKIAISINLDWPMRRYYSFFEGIQSYSSKYTNWALVWDHFPENVLKTCTDKPYYDGIIGRIKHNAYNEACRLNIPVVNNWFSSDIKDIDSVYTDHEKAGQMAAEHLLKRGFRNFASIDTRNEIVAKTFYKGFLESIKPYGCKIKRYYINRKCTENEEQWLKFHLDFNAWIKEWTFPIGIACSMAAIAPRVTTRCLENDLRIPEDVALVTSGNDQNYCEGISPKVSSVDTDYFKNGYEAARMLDRKLKGEKITESPIFIPPKGFIARESTDTYAVNDPLVKTALRYIADNCDKNIQIIDVVEQVPISRRSLEIRFNKEIGHTMVDEINRLRIMALKRLLLESDTKMNKLYRQAGFSSALHMRRVFSKCTGMTPGQFRKANKSS
ncbi:MAG: substrate-binding domain-containing protein [Lentisphaeraceae bacterium]|nr:substrate-binding domain-containing protein [Lentisphaeraceae bacterium]